MGVALALIRIMDINPIRVKYGTAQLQGKTRVSRSRVLLASGLATRLASNLLTRRQF